MQAAHEEFRQALPLRLRDIDSDNGSDFINQHLWDYWQAQEIQFTRGRPLPGGAKLGSFGLYPTVTMGPGGHVAFTPAPTATGEGGEAIYTADTARLP